ITTQLTNKDSVLYKRFSEEIEKLEAQENSDIWSDANYQVIEYLKSRFERAVKRAESNKFDLEAFKDFFIPIDYKIREWIVQSYMVPLAEFWKDDFDLHRPYVDNVIFIKYKGHHNYVYYFREPDLIDVWFDSGAMPYAQWHFPFENKEEFEKNFPADFIAEGVDQTRGWFYTLHALAVLLFDSVAYKTVVSNGLVLDKNGN